ncbi:MAG: hemerythrin family protein [Planctomycetaceae bacterium]|jgi:hemerythrin|nr:hemerythrin family protein [Planctomycetaceae bacterium]
MDGKPTFRNDRQAAVDEIQNANGRKWEIIMAYAWSKDLETGNLLIDTQHQQLIKAVNELLAACSTGQGRDVLNNTLNFLESYTAKHFGDEERLQIQHQYPDYTNHKVLHENFKKFVNELVNQIKTSGATTSLVSKVTFGVGDWLVNHIKKEDMKVAVYIKSKEN